MIEKEVKMSTKNVRVSVGPGYEKKDLLVLDPVLLRALLHERVHHTIEVPLYPILVKGQEKALPAFGAQAQVVYDVWRERGLNETDPDLQWVKGYIEIAEKIRKGEKIEWKESLPQPFSANELSVVRKLIYERRSIRDWLDKPISDQLIEQLLEAGRAAPIGCNLDEVRFIVVKNPKETKAIWSDIPVDNAIIIVIAYDTRIHPVVGQDKSVPQNAGYDAAAAGDHILLMAHALGLGAVWLSKRVLNRGDSADTGEEFRKHYGLPDYIKVALHIAVGWPAIGTIKSNRVPLKDLILPSNNT